MSDITAMVVIAAIFVAAVLLCLSGDYIRRRTGGRFRHAEIHLVAWLPVLGFDVLVLYSQGTQAFENPVIFLIPMFAPVAAYSRFYLKRIASPTSWRRSEERLDAADAVWQDKQERRERIEAYKHGKRPAVEPGHGGSGPIMDLRMSVPPSTAQPASAAFDRLPVSSKRQAGANPAGLRALEGWRLKIAVVLQFVLIFSVTFSLVLELDNALRLSAPVDPAFFAYAGVVAVVSTILVAVLTRGLSFFLPTLAMAVSLAGLLASLRALNASDHQGLLFSVAWRVVGYLVIAGSMTLLMWSIAALFSFSWKKVPR